MKSIRFSKDDIIRHIAIWILIIIFLCISDPYIGTLITQIVGMSITIISYMISYYIISLFIFPKYYTRPVYIVLFLISTLFLFLIISYFKNYHILVALKSPSDVTTRPIDQFLISYFLLFSIVAYCGASFYFNKLRIYKLEIQNEKERVLLLQELVYFKNQFGPHITFNFLNYCYSHVHKNSEEAAKAIELYSDILRYSSENLSESQVLLEKEIEYLNNYIGLRKLLNKKVFVDFEIKGHIKGKLIYPRLLLTFIENAFKHGIYNDRETPIKITVLNNSDQLTFRVDNKISPHKMNVGSGIGLQNARKLLKLHYQNKHYLELEETNGQYYCNLNLNLS